MVEPPSPDVAAPQPAGGAGRLAGDEGVPPQRYSGALAAEIEARWQARWLADGTFVVAAEPDPAREKFFLMDMFPYPSGSGLHVGHPLGYIATDVYGRFLRMQGRAVLHTLGYDAFGLPAEQYAIQTGTHPRVTTEANVERYRAQIARLGLAHDPTRSVSTTDEAFYRWTQWIFLQIYNSWYDQRAGRARPVADLVAAYESGELPTPDGRPWADLDRAGRAAAVDARRLAYRATVPVNWCPGLGTVLANEEVTAEGRSERGNFPVFRRELTQWMMRITAFADRLLDDLDRLDWPASVKTMQRNWIGRSEGAAVRFPLHAPDGGADGAAVEVFTTRPDTLFGATYMVLAPEHPLVDALVPPAWPAADLPASWTAGAPDPRGAVEAYRRAAAALGERDRTAEGRTKTGVFTGGWATNPVTGEAVPVFVADYVLAGYGTGAIMAVPAHDQRDFDFARAFDLPIRAVIAPGDGRDPTDTAAWPDAWTGDGTVVGSAGPSLALDGLGVEEAKRAVVAWLEGQGLGRGTVTYKLRDWLFSRQRYWGEPFPIVFDDDGIAHDLPESMLPVLLPEVDDYRPVAADPDDGASDPEPPLAKARDWVEVTLDLGDGPRRYRRETNTMPQWAGSCWYELRYLDPDDDRRFVDPTLEAYWMGPRTPDDTGGVDLYVGGVEHAVLHLLYSRFWHKVLHDLGHVSSSEPFRRLFNQGYIQAYAYTDRRGVYVPAEEVVERDGGYWYGDEPVTRSYGKMGKSLRNSVSPDEMCDRYGADTLRLYEMSMGPLDVSRPWETRAVVGSLRFLQRVWRNLLDEETGAPTVTDTTPDPATEQLLHATIDAVRTEMGGLRFNTAIAKLIELNNHLTSLPAVPREVAEPLVLMLAPFAPHAAEELWRRLGHPSSLAFEPFPVADAAKVAAATVTMVVQVNGKPRDRIEVDPAISESAAVELALASDRVRAALGGGEPKKVVAKPPRVVNVVA
ncbi:MAG TPA: leucine--tRNA ligase [Acidimicrobiales bacterium]|nr:leucine--tRNA ligase [Acidimicrobiales bacterium]